MGLLAPLYIAGFLAISLPIIFHLIRRNPHGRQTFSSLMFLAASPPRLTRRSRLTNILLLILRATALMLLAFAFARPFFHSGADLSSEKTSGRRIALLLDASASMQRGDLWKQATAHIDDVLKDLTPADEVALYLFDARTHGVLTFSEWNEAQPANRLTLLRARLADAKPGWGPTRLGDALATVADLLGETEKSAATAPGTSPPASPAAPDHKTRQIVLISDLQQGAHAESLQGHEWPKNVTLDVRPVTLKPASNASLQWVKQDDTLAAAAGKTSLRVRVSNEPDSQREQFTLTWANEHGPIPDAEPLKVYVAPGRSQIVRVPWPTPRISSPPATEPAIESAPATAPATRTEITPAHNSPALADRLLLTGDEVDFDNTLFVVTPRTDTVRVLFVGDDAPDDLKNLRFYLRSALADTPQRTVELTARTSQQELTDADLADTRLVVIDAPPSDAASARLRRYLESGGDILWVLKDTAAVPALAQLLGAGPLDAQEATGDFALLSRVDVDHPLFAPFADARYGDFTHIHFWHHRRLHLPAPSPESAGLHVLAWFDNDDPFLLEKVFGKGTLRVMTSGWHPADSQLALSTKFVPLMEGLLKRKDEVIVDAQYAVGDPIALPAALLAGAGGTLPAGRALLFPDGHRADLPPGAATFDGADQPGIYHLLSGGRQIPLAVNVAPDESRTIPMGAEELEKWGATLARAGGKPSPEQAMQERRLRAGELENRQKVWRWLIVAVLGLLGAETVLAGRLARRALHDGATT